MGSSLYIYPWNSLHHYTDTVSILWFFTVYAHPKDMGRGARGLGEWQVDNVRTNNSISRNKSVECLFGWRRWHRLRNRATLSWAKRTNAHTGMGVCMCNMLHLPTGCCHIPILWQFPCCNLAQVQSAILQRPLQTQLLDYHCWNLWIALLQEHGRSTRGEG